MSFQFSATIKQLLARRHYQQLVAWIIAVGVAVIISSIGRAKQIEPQIIGQFAWLFIVDSAVFLAIYRDYPKLGLVMLIFMYSLLLAVFGYFMLASVSLAQ